ncbi:MAG: tRNA 2-thiocytidine biosynthesis TtcA family protein [Bacilli bacterium]
MKIETTLQEIERAIIKKYRKQLWAPFVKGIIDYELIKPKDKIMVCISGGKDSLLLAKLLQEYQKHGQDVDIQLEFVAMNPGFHPQNTQAMIDNAKHLGIPLRIFESDIFKVVDMMAVDFPCYMCARMRRGSLYSYAQELGCNKIALGHHFDDIIETTLMNVLYSGTFKTMMPKLKASNYENMELIRPMLNIREKDIISYTNYIGIKPMDCGCEVSAGKYASSRYEIKKLIFNYKKTFEGVDKSIFAAATNVNMDAIIGYSKKGVKHSFLDDYEGEDEDVTNN